jgi:hypothetical protein
MLEVLQFGEAWMMRHFVKGHTVIFCHTAAKVTFSFRGQTILVGPKLLDGFLFLGGKCEGTHFELTLN